MVRLSLRRIKQIVVPIILILSLTPILAFGLICPDGAYIGRDNSGNEACRDIQTNNLIDPLTGLQFDPQTGAPVFQVEGIEEYGVAIFIAIIIIIIIAVAIAKSTGGEKQVVERSEFSQLTKDQVMDLQGSRCAKCGKRPTAWDFHHKGMRDDNSVSNCEGLCLDCHRLITLKEKKDEHSRNDSD